MDFRLDRLVTLYLVSPLMRFGSEKQLSIPILMYHSIAEEDEAAMHTYYRTATSPTVFAVQMEYLHQNGYEACSLAQGIAQLKASRRSGVKSVVITFDDGYRNFYLKAFPLLNQFGFSATVFLPTAYIGENTLQFKGRDCLTWSEVRELQKFGILFGSHTVTHPQLDSLDKDAIESEIVHSKNAIEEKTGCAVESFAYPYAFPQAKAEFRKTLRESLCGAGYRNGVCTIVGRARRGSDPFFMERLPVNTFDDMALFQAKLVGGYDWMAKPQSGIKVAKSWAARIVRREQNDGRRK